VLYSVDDYYTVQPVTPSLSASSGDHQTTVTTTEQVTHFYTRSPSFYNRIDTYINGQNFTQKFQAVAENTANNFRGGVTFCRTW